jgi:histidine ammonia-lyase
LQEVYAAVRAHSPHFTADRYWADEMSALQSAVLGSEFAAEGVALD